MTDPLPSRSRSPCTRLLPIAAALVMLCMQSFVVYGKLGLTPPGVTSDEPFNARQGLYLVNSCERFGTAILNPFSIQAIFESPLHLPDHPPLGRLAIGLCHRVLPHSVRMTFPISDADESADALVLSYPAARMASVIWLAATIGLITHWTQKHLGTIPAIFAAVSTMAMPRLLAHGLLASLESCVGFWFCWTVLFVAGRWSSSLPSQRVVALTGLLLGMTFLSKIQAVLLVPPLGVWMLWRWRWAALRLIPVLGITSGSVFVLGWPWLWSDVWGRSLQYFARTTDRAPIQVWYVGRQWLDQDVPWHAPWATVCVTIPSVALVLLILAFCPTRSVLQSGPAASESVEHLWSKRLLLMVVTAVLAVFSWPGIAVYDSARLFLVVYPLLGVLVGFGAFRCQTFLVRHRPHLPSIPQWSVVLVTAAVCLATGWQFRGLLADSPSLLSQYSTTVRGIRGAERFGFELDYWGASISDELLRKMVEEFPSDQVIDVVPVPHPVSIDELERRVFNLTGERRSFRALDHRNWSEVGAILYFRRMADLPWFLRQESPPAGIERVCTHSSENVLLAAVVKVNPRQLDPDSPTNR